MCWTWSCSSATVQGPGRNYYYRLYSIESHGRQTHQWFSGKIQRCHRWAPSSILGWCKIFHWRSGHGSNFCFALISYTNPPPALDPPAPTNLLFTSPTHGFPKTVSVLPGPFPPVVLILKEFNTKREATNLKFGMYSSLDQLNAHKQTWHKIVRSLRGLPHDHPSKSRWQLTRNIIF